jgi:hypothetical protein
MSTDLVIATVSLAVLLVFVQSVRRATGIGVPWWAFAISVVLLTFVFPIGLLPLVILLMVLPNGLFGSHR